MRAKHVKVWLQGIVEEEDPESQRNQGKGDNWVLFVKLVQAVWTHGPIPCQLLWSTVVLIPKGGGTITGLGYSSRFGRYSNGLWIIGSTLLSCMTAFMAVAQTTELAPRSSKQRWCSNSRTSN